MVLELLAKRLDNFLFDRISRHLKIISLCVLFNLVFLVLAVRLGDILLPKLKVRLHKFRSCFCDQINVQLDDSTISCFYSDPRFADSNVDDSFIQQLTDLYRDRLQAEYPYFFDMIVGCPHLPEEMEFAC